MSSLSHACRRVRPLISPTLVSADLRSSLLRYSSSSQNVKPDVNKIYLGDTLAFVKRLEAEGMPNNQAEAIITTITDVANDSLEHASSSFASKSGMDKFEAVQGSNFILFMSEIKNMQENNFQMIKHEVEKMDLKFTSKFDKDTTAVKFEIEKVKEEIISKFDREILAAKFEIINWCVGSFVSIAAISLAIVRFWMK